MSTPKDGNLSLIHHSYLGRLSFRHLINEVVLRTSRRELKIKERSV